MVRLQVERVFIRYRESIRTNTDIVSDKLDQLIDVMNQQIDFNKQQADLKETEDVKEKVGY